MKLFYRVNEVLIAEDKEEAKVCNLSKPSFEAIADYLDCDADELRVAGLEEYNKLEDKVYTHEYDDTLRRRIDIIESHGDIIDTAVKGIEYDGVEVFEFEHKVYIVITDIRYGYTRVFRK